MALITYHQTLITFVLFFSEMNKFRQQVYVICLEVTLLIR